MKCARHTKLSLYTHFSKKCAYRDILVCMAHFSIYSEQNGMYVNSFACLLTTLVRCFVGAWIYYCDYIIINVDR